MLPQTNEQCHNGFCTRSSLHCSVPQCSNSSKFNSQLSFHHFPADPGVKSVWVAQIRRDKFSPTNGTRVCSLHFLPSDFICVPNEGRRHLKKEAVLYSRRVCVGVVKLAAIMLCTPVSG
uniref:THAP domain-containing protein 1 n=1 Tax=Sparus aurata TaxID=8175 RepID=A0A671VEZ7_SPAAU